MKIRPLEVAAHSVPLSEGARVITETTPPTSVEPQNEELLGHMQLALQTVEKLQNAAGFGFQNDFHDQLPTAIQDGDHYRFLVHVHSDIFDVVTHLSCLLGGKVIRANAYLSPKVKCHAPADLPTSSCSLFPPLTLCSHIQLQPWKRGALS